MRGDIKDKRWVELRILVARCATRRREFLFVCVLSRGMVSLRNRENG